MTLSKYSKPTQDYIKAVQDYITNKYGKVNAEWEAILMLLADNLDLYKACMKSVKENGIYNSENGKKNPLLATMKDLQATIIKEIQHLGLSPYAVSKIKCEMEDDTDDFIEELTGGNN